MAVGVPLGDLGACRSSGRAAAMRGLGCAAPAQLHHALRRCTCTGSPPAGTIKPGYSKLGGNDTLDIVSAFQSYGGFTAGLIDEDQRCDIVRNSCPGPGAFLLGILCSVGRVRCDVAMGSWLPLPVTAALA